MHPSSRTVPPPAATDWTAIDALLRLALAEDIGPGDATTLALAPPERAVRARFVARGEGVMAGGPVLERLFAHLGPDGRPLPAQDAPPPPPPTESARLLARLHWDGKSASASGVTWSEVLPDSAAFFAGDVLAEITGPSTAVLAAERTALNLLSRLCGVAARTRAFVDAVRATPGAKARILDTRKTCPGHRALDKWAVRAGGGRNHRMGLYDMVLIKDNHLALFGWPSAAVRAARAHSDLPVMVEVDTFAQLEDVLSAEPDYVLLDNMTPERLGEAVRLVDWTCRERKWRRPSLEASGGVTLETVGAVAASGVDRISVGALTQGVPAVDIGLDF